VVVFPCIHMKHSHAYNKNKVSARRISVSLFYIGCKPMPD